MFFQSMKNLLATNASINLTIVNNGSDLTVTVIPRNNQSDLKQPLSITASAEELDAGLIDALKDFTQEHKTLSEQLAEQKANLQKEAKALATPSSKGKTKSATASSLPESGDDKNGGDDGFGGDEGEDIVVPRPQVQSEPKVQAEPNLFDMEAN